VRRSTVSLVALSVAFAAGAALAQTPPPATVTFARDGHAQVQGAPRVRDVDAAFDSLAESFRGCAGGQLGAIDGPLELRLVVHGNGTVTEAIVVTRPDGAGGSFVLCVTGVARRMRLPSFRSHDAAVVIHARVHAPAAAHH